MPTYEIVEDAGWPWGPPCEHWWDDCPKHPGQHEECYDCGALRYTL